MYAYQIEHRYFAQVAEDIKDSAQAELEALGAKEPAAAYRGIYFTADTAALYRINLHARLISRVLAPLLTFKCHSDRYLYKQAFQVEWSDFLSPDQQFSIFAMVSHSAIRHSRFAALRLKDAIADWFTAKSGNRPSVNRTAPDVWFNLHIENNRATISVDTSGGSLHKRGYRRKTTPAPMVETLAAAVVEATAWDGEQPLADPMCGSGTLLCEAWIKATRTPPGILRRSFGFQRLPDYDPALWESIRGQALEHIRPLPEGFLQGADKSAACVAAARTNCAVLAPNRRIRIQHQDFFKGPGIRDQIILCNPPYGIRLTETRDLPAFYRRLGDFLKRRCCGSTAYIYFGDRTHLKHIGLRPSWKKALSTGGLDGRLARFPLY